MKEVVTDKISIRFQNLGYRCSRLTINEDLNVQIIVHVSALLKKSHPRRPARPQSDHVRPGGYPGYSRTLC